MRPGTRLTAGTLPATYGCRAVTNDGVPRTRAKERVMLWTIFVVLLVLWALGLVTSYTLGGFIHILLIIAIAVVLIRIIQGRRPI
jgi:hypothetical protein